MTPFYTFKNYKRVIPLCGFEARRYTAREGSPCGVCIVPHGRLIRPPCLKRLSEEGIYAGDEAPVFYTVEIDWGTFIPFVSGPCTEYFRPWLLENVPTFLTLRHDPEYDFEGQPGGLWKYESPMYSDVPGLYPYFRFSLRVFLCTKEARLVLNYGTAPFGLDPGVVDEIGYDIRGGGIDLLDSVPFTFRRFHSAEACATFTPGNFVLLPPI